MSVKSELKGALKNNQDVLRARLQEALNDSGWTATVLAERSGVARSTIYNFVSGLPLGELAFQKIAAALGVSPDWLVGLSSSKHGGSEGMQLASLTDLQNVWEQLVTPVQAMTPEQRQLLIATAWAWVAHSASSRPPPADGEGKRKPKAK